MKNFFAKKILYNLCFLILLTIQKLFEQMKKKFNKKIYFNIKLIKKV